MAHKGETVAGRYRLLEKLGAGALGEVWAARDDHTERELALKLLRPKWQVAAKSLESFFREAKAAAKIRHGSIVELIDAGEADDAGARVPFVAMELLEAEKLEEVLDRVPTLSVGTALRLACDLAWALVAAHEKGIVHERIEPANVLLHRDVRGDVVPKLVDFGVSRLVEDLEVLPGAAHDALSPLQYLSPEQIHADVELDGRADVYGLAALLHRCLVGSAPFDGPSVEEILDQIEEGPKKLEPFEPPIDNKVIQLVSDGLQRNRKLRPTMRVFAERLDALLERIDAQWKAFGAQLSIPDERTIEHIQKLRPAKVLAKVQLIKQAQTTPIISAREEMAQPARHDPREELEPPPDSAPPISSSALEELPPSIPRPQLKKSVPPPLPLPGLHDAPPISQIIQDKMRTTKSNALALDVLADLEKELLKHVARGTDPGANAPVPKLDDIFGAKPVVSDEARALLETPPPDSQREPRSARDAESDREPGEKKKASEEDTRREKKRSDEPRVNVAKRVREDEPGRASRRADDSEPPVRAADAAPQKSSAALILAALAAIALVIYLVLPKGGNAQEGGANAAPSPAPTQPFATPPVPTPTIAPVELPTVTAPAPTAAPVATAAPTEAPTEKPPGLVVPKAPQPPAPVAAPTAAPA
ncbi:MAG: protein kinase, partial [Deltaproteobacteria bacterium]|nr:protein kinase [Deltaproteobacteria bacterium]